MGTVKSIFSMDRYDTGNIRTVHIGFMEIDFYDGGELRWIRFGRKMVDFRDFYVVWIERGEDDFNPEFEGWGAIWFLEYELSPMKKKYPTLRYKKLSFFKVNGDDLRPELYKLLKYIFVLLIGILIGKYYI